MLKKIISTIAFLVMMVGYVQPIFAVSSSGTGKWVAGQYDSGIKTTESSAKTGVIIRRLTNYTTGEKITVFCAEFGAESSTGNIESAQHIIPTDPLMKTACKIAYLGWYSKYTDYAVDGGILTEGFKQVKLDYVFTQQMIWEVLGQSNATFIDSNIQNQYISFKNQINSSIENIEKKPSFSDTTIDVGKTKILTDSNGVLGEYPSFDKTIENIRFVHNKGENTITVTVNENCTLDKYFISEETMKSWGIIKESTIDNDTTVFFSFRDGVQDQLYSMNYNNPVSMSINLNINLLGNIELTKLNQEGKLIDGAIVTITGPENFYKEIIVQNGKIVINELKTGIYTIREKTAPNGYLLNPNTYTVEVRANQTTKQAIVNEEPTGQIIIIKQDSETGSVAQGDATLENAIYKVYANEDIYNAAKTKKFYSKGDLVATRTTNSKGETEPVTNLPLGKYLVKEEVAPVGYMLDSQQYEIDLTYKNQDTKIVTETVVSKDKVKGMQVHIYKSGIKENSGLVQGLKGAEFTIKLYRDVNNQLKAGKSYTEALKIAPTYAVITIDKNGAGYTPNKLPYGEYLVTETKTPEDFETAKDFIFSITQDESEIQDIAHKIKHLYVNNVPMESYIKLVKKDAESGKIITLNSTTFEIKATKDIYDRGTGEILYKTGETINQKVGNTVYSKFTTNADNIIVPENSYNNKNDEKGSIITPLSLPVGSYEIVEVKAPTGFLKLNNNITFEIKGIKDYNKNEYGDYIKEIVVKNDKPTGTLIVDKVVDKQDNVDVSIIDISNFSGIQFKLSAKEDIIDNVDGSIIYTKGQEISTYNLDKNGTLKIENLPLGIYELQEVKTFEGLVIDNNKYEICFKQADQVIKVYTETVQIKNNTTLVEISKIDENGKMLSGAKLIIKDENGVVIDSWISSDETYKIEGLVVGKTYTLYEEFAPEGYMVAKEIEFVVEKQEQLVQMKDEPILKTIKIIKLDSETKEVIKSDFKFGIYEDAECQNLIKIVESNKENGTAIFENLKYGIYYINEVEAPSGYLLSNKVIKVEINENGVFTDEELFEENDSIATMNFYNKLIPEIQTGNERNYLLLSSNILISLIGIIFLSRKYVFEGGA